MTSMLDKKIRWYEIDVAYASGYCVLAGWLKSPGHILNGGGASV